MATKRKSSKAKTSKSNQKKPAKKTTLKPLKSRKEILSDAYKNMLRARAVDTKSIILYKQNKSFFQIGCAGHEAVGVAFAKAMTAGKDWFYPYYRDMALVSTLGMTNEELMLNILSKADDPNSGGRQMPMHYGHEILRIVNQSSPTGTQFLQAVGTAMGIKYLGEDEVVYVSAGEGTTAQGSYHEALNWAGREKLPIIFVIQDNQFAISVHISEHIAGGSVERISSGYDGVDVKRVNGLDFEETLKAANNAVNRARKGDGPSVLIFDVVRLQSHSISDNQTKYRSTKDIEKDQKKDPILLLEKKLIKEKILSKKDIENIRHQINKDVDDAASWAEQQSDPKPDTALDFVLRGEYPEPVSEPILDGNEEFLVDALNHALHEEMARNPKMIIYGQDVGYGKGGVFSVTTGLTDAFGSSRCFNSPLAEDSIVGTAIGLSVMGYKPVVEIQFGDYIWTAMMQIRNELAALYYRSNGTFSCPAVIRVAVGGYIRGALYHSQNIEATFAHFPGLVVIYPSNAGEAKGLLKSAIRSNDPVLFLEHKGLYRQVFAKSQTGGADDLVPIGKARIARHGTHASVITWGALVHRSLVVAEELSHLGYEIEVIDIRTISPLDKETILESVRKTSRALIAHEDIEFSGFGSEIAALIADQAFSMLDAPVKRLGAAFSMIPQAPALEAVVLPSKDSIKKALIELLEY
ncbi:MAG TPA: dehydrogenase E1 component subunit alpha/beta [Oligoflexia bacterium]|nr:dehydrogenase E1 component subunit alpha/beta [Oligoflexia bacterium]HMP48207.1 dehydrogenase E1 component subunit alpha/beta [Oligoflexia bacterium]